MKQGWKKRLTVALALMLAMAVLPLASVLAESAAAYGKVTADQVFVRKQPNTNADYWFRVDANHVVQILDEVTQNGKSWYQVKTADPNAADETYTGYIVKDFVEPLSEGETAVALSNSVAVITTVTGRQGEITAGGTNFRMSPSTSGEKIMTLERGVVVEITSIPEAVDGDHWYGVRYGGYDGYIMSTYIRLLPEDTSSSVGNVLVHGYIKLIKSSANLRTAPNGNVAISDGWKPAGDIRPYVSTPVAAGGYTWYEVVENGVRYWVRSDCVQTVDSTGANVVPPTASSTTTPGESATTQGYVITTIGGVNLRLQPFGESFAQIKKGVTLPYEHVVLPYSTNNNSKYTWYYVVYNNLHGYVRSDCVTVTTSSGSTVTAGPGATTAPSGTTTYGYVKMIKKGVNLRTTPGGKSQEQLDIGTVVPVIGATMNASIYTWYPVRAASGRTGYVRSDCVVLCNADGTVGSSSGSTGPTDSAPTATPAPTPENGVYGYVQITIDKTFIRATMNGDKLFRVETKGGIYPMWGQPGNKNNYVWYPIVVNGQKGWVRGDCAKLVDASGATAAPSATETPSGSTQAVAYVITIKNNVNLRVSASTDSSSRAKVALSTVMPYSTTVTSGGYTWYRVTYNGTQLWVRGDCVRVMTQTEYDAWLQQQNPSTTPSTAVTQGHVKTTASSVNIRKTANGSTTGRRVEKSGTVLPYSEKRTVSGVVWYYITTSDGFSGWINGNYATETDGNGTASTPTTPPAPDGDYVPPTKGQEASYTTLKRGSSGTAVTNLVTELKLQGYYNGEITSTYTSAVEEAVKAFQKAKGLKVDGIAGSETQHALFQTVPLGTGSSSEFTFYPAEKIDWFTGTINKDWVKGTSAKIYDVKTGIVWTARRWSGGNHAEVEPLTADDTKRLCESYGVSKASQIPWNYRPVLVLIGNHNYCASIYAKEHTSTSDGVISNNNFTGTMCVHFTNSKTHDSNVVNAGHQEDIEYAYTHAPGGQK